LHVDGTAADELRHWLGGDHRLSVCDCRLQLSRGVRGASGRAVTPAADSRRSRWGAFRSQFFRTGSFFSGIIIAQFKTVKALISSIRLPSKGKYKNRANEECGS
jgi:hypothetical protein